MRATSMQFSHFFSRTRVGIIDMIIDTVSERVWVGLWDERALYPNSGVSQYDCEARTAGVRCRGLNKSPTPRVRHRQLDAWCLVVSRHRMVGLLSSRLDRSDDTQAASSPVTPALSLRKRLVLIVLNLAGWFTVSIGLTMYNKWMFFYSGFHFPLLVSSLHIAIKIPLAAAAMCKLGVPGLRLARSRQSLLLIITGCATALDIGLSNLAFLFISVTSYTIGKSSVPMWILLMSVALGLQRPSAPLAGVVAAIVAGITVSTSPGPGPSPSPSLGSGPSRKADPHSSPTTDPNPNPDQLASVDPTEVVAHATGQDASNDAGGDGNTTLGLALVLCASLLSAVRWSLTHLLLKDLAAPAPAAAAANASSIAVVLGAVTAMR